MRKLGPVIVIALAALSLGGCGRAGGGVFGNKGPDEFQVARRAPLVIPPDFAMRPPRPGAPRPQEADSSTQALNALFGGQQRVSGGEAALLNSAGRPGEPGMRSEAGDPDTTVVNKGATTRDILNAPVGAGQEATATTPQ